MNMDAAIKNCEIYLKQIKQYNPIMLIIFLMNTSFQ